MVTLQHMGMCACTVMGSRGWMDTASILHPCLCTWQLLAALSPSVQMEPGEKEGKGESTKVDGAESCPCRKRRCRGDTEGTGKAIDSQDYREKR